MINQQTEVELQRTLRTRWPNFRRAEYVIHDDRSFTVVLEDSTGQAYAFRLSLSLDSRYTVIPIYPL